MFDKSSNVKHTLKATFPGTGEGDLKHLSPDCNPREFVSLRAVEFSTKYLTKFWALKVFISAGDLGFTGLRNSRVLGV